MNCSLAASPRSTAARRSCSLRSWTSPLASSYLASRPSWMTFDSCHSSSCGQQRVLADVVQVEADEVLVLWMAPHLNAHLILPGHALPSAEGSALLSFSSRWPGLVPN